MYSCVGKRYKHTIQSCLDQVIVNSEWLACFPASGAEFLGFFGSDHPRWSLILPFVKNGDRRQFRFDKRLFQQSNFRDYVAKGWNSFNLRNNFSI